ncbi:diguanylate cyclase domain-containing protein [Nostoc sp. UHCC 0252]|uniref:diguanylate cyclase domain-containing protein n=1 Tax=Nostoc sp. UHCC 0252 TaxID=3110241 RepID=UPI002B20D2DD|nr:diguanylate cyclase [Nostoc sp. UHCC 0252]MEA5605990.1 diguanylate cyclase [Nostoc sp. UHCC 0252]
MYSNHLSGYETDLKQILDKIRMLADQIHQSFELSEILNIIVTEVRKTLETDRAIIYRFLPDGDGCVGVIEDINNKTFDPCYKKLLTDLQIRANLVVPILVNNQKIDGVSSIYPHLWGLLIAHQCSGSRQWSALEIEYFQLIAAELGIALGQAECHQRLAISHQKLTPQLNEDLKILTVQPKSKLRSIKRILHKNLRKSIILINEKDITKQQAALQERLRIEEALRDSEQRYRSVIAAMAEGIVLQQSDGQITACNDSAERILGLTADQMMGRTSIDPRWQAIHEDGTPFPGETHPAIVTLRTGQPQFHVIMGVHKPDGSLTWISINSQPLFESDELKPYAVVASFTDITVCKQAQLALQQQTERERLIYASAQHIRESLDLDEILNTTVAEVRQFLQTDRVILYRFNPDWSGVVVTESVAKGCQAILNMEITETYFVERQRQFYQQNTVKATSDIYTAGLTLCHLEFLEKLQVRAKLVVPILQGDRLWGILVAHHCSAPREWQTWEGELLGQLATQVAIAIQQSELYQQLQRANQQLEKMVMVDELTQIANRRCFDHRLDSVWQYLLREQGFISLLLCDIDYFKQYNDTYGHATGDDCLRFIAQAFKQSVKRSRDLAARYGGEEFVVILPNTASDGAFHVAQEIHKAIQQLNIPHATSAVKHHVTLSIGIATVIPTPNMVPLDLIEAADQALYQAKANGRNCSCIKNNIF